ncbi:hypothetical protein KIPB_003013 [Kipferlia bialata]|uniref:Uncharacterized protein n=1 Tax=Kipferlia bialata TaxID=797122 RepID=A0A9K3GGV0_9EUKA|nr:hypothetical protein KIPB_003013 [Kipferlia bialata]|eukprot:g3013.t1
MQVEGFSLLDSYCPEGDPMLYLADENIPESFVSAIGTRVLSQFSGMHVKHHVAAAKKEKLFSGLSLIKAFHALGGFSVLDSSFYVDHVYRETGLSLATHGLVSVTPGKVADTVTMTQSGHDLRLYLLECMRVTLSPPSTLLGDTHGGLPPFPASLPASLRPQPYQILALATVFGKSPGCIVKALGFPKSKVDAIKGMARDMQRRHITLLPLARTLYDTEVDPSVSSIPLCIGDDTVVSLSDVIHLGYLTATLKRCVRQVEAARKGGHTNPFHQ